MAEQYVEQAIFAVADLTEKPGLTMILVGNNPSSIIYVNNKQKLCQRIGIRSQVLKLPATSSEQEVLALIEQQNLHPTTHGILLQMPLPAHLNSSYLLRQISPKKDVDGLHPYNLGLLAYGQPGLIPCTPQGCLQMIQSVRPDITGAKAVVLGRSVLVGKSMSMVLCNNDASVTLLHAKSMNIKQECQSADIIVSATGQPGLFDKSYFNKDAIVIDVGITSVEGNVKGDVNFDDVFGHVYALTPVPGGVGPMTVVNLMLNTLRAIKNI